jgi:hypothetical protein
MNRCKYAHVTDLELRAILNQEIAIGPEELDYAIRQTIQAWEQDNWSINKAYMNLEDSSYTARRWAISDINENWGNGEDGNSIAFKSCQTFWNV